MDLMSTLARTFATAHPMDAARRLSSMPPQEAGSLLDTLEPQTVAAVLENLDPGAAGALITAMQPERAGRALETLAFHRGVGVIRQLDRPSRERLLAATSTRYAARLRWAASMAPGTVATITDSTRNVFRTTSSVGDALDQGLDPRLAYLYIVDAADRLVGVIHRAVIEAAEKPVPLESLMTTTVLSVPASTPLTTVREHPAWAKYDTLPVTDARGTYVGVLRHKTVHAVEPPPAADSQSAVLSTVLEVGEAVWTGMYAAIENLSVTHGSTATGERR